jgi:hypothetical protein
MFPHWLFGANELPVIWPPLAVQPLTVLTAGTHLISAGAGQLNVAASAVVDQLADTNPPTTRAAKSFALMTLLPIFEAGGEKKFLKYIAAKSQRTCFASRALTEPLRHADDK